MTNSLRPAVTAVSTALISASLLILPNIVFGYSALGLGLASKAIFVSGCLALCAVSLNKCCGRKLSDTASYSLMVAGIYIALSIWIVLYNQSVDASGIVALANIGFFSGVGGSICGNLAHRLANQTPNE